MEGCPDELAPRGNGVAVNEDVQRIPFQLLQRPFQKPPFPFGDVSRIAFRVRIGHDDLFRMKPAPFLPQYVTAVSVLESRSARSRVKFGISKNGDRPVLFDDELTVPDGIIFFRFIGDQQRRAFDGNDFPDRIQEGNGRKTPVLFLHRQNGFLIRNVPLPNGGKNFLRRKQFARRSLLFADVSIPRAHSQNQSENRGGGYRFFPFHSLSSSPQSAF